MEEENNQNWHSLHSLFLLASLVAALILLTTAQQLQMTRLRRKTALCLCDQTGGEFLEEYTVRIIIHQNETPQTRGCQGFIGGSPYLGHLSLSNKSLLLGSDLSRTTLHFRSGLRGSIRTMSN
jgi:hypothetical protein